MTIQSYQTVGASCARPSIYQQPSFKCHFHTFQNVKLFFQYVLNIALVCGTMYAQKYRVLHFRPARTKLPILLQQTSIAKRHLEEHRNAKSHCNYHNEHR